MSWLGGTVTGMMVGDAMGALPQRATVPATSNSSTAKQDGNGKPLSKTPTAKQSLWLSAFYVVGAIGILLLGSRALQDARIG